MSMTPEEAIKVVEKECDLIYKNKFHYNWVSFQAWKICASLARAQLEQQDKVKQVLDDLISEITNPHRHPWFMHQVNRVRAKYCPPKEEDKTMACGEPFIDGRPSQELTQQPTIEQVLDELSQRFRSGYSYYYSTIQKEIKRIRNKYCPEPTPVEKPTLKEIFEEFIKLERTSTSAKIPLRDSCYAKLLDQLKQVE